MDARSLLRAKKAEARINHPYASYNASGVLRCSICAIPVKQWDAHLLTKQHRTSVAREKAEKEKAERAKRPRQDVAESSSKRARTGGKGGDDAAPSGLPAGFFSAKSQPATSAEEEDGQIEKDVPASAPPPAPPAKTGDSELDDFLASLTDDTPSTTTANPILTTTATKRKTVSYKQDEIPGQASYEAAPVLNLPAGADEDQQKEEPQESEAEKRERLEKEEKEEIVARLEEEERAQEDADSRVTALKQRMEMLKKKREARGGVKVKGKVVAQNGA